ncbi:nucleolar protein dao-5 isoform X1 [Cyprinodon tularosa]|uniref:nucleolar protein dao-5 isoform X1 n=1 Tax=Cyprinodon tularosa TaxID=77115 RepID=UPI0018E1E2BA|nr:nucleolar protein dao-5 isoform X1 [Cyprinodon tularosa]
MEQPYRTGVTKRITKKKLEYFTGKQSLPNGVGETFTYEDVSKFDDEVCAPEPNLQLVLLQSSVSETLHSEESISPASRKDLPAAKPSEPHISLHGQDPSELVPFDIHEPMKTSSPIIQNMIKRTREKQDENEDLTVTPIFFINEDEESHPDAVATHKPQCNGQSTEEIDELDSPPSRITLTKVFSHKAKLNIPSKGENIKKSVVEEPKVVSPTKQSKCVSSQPPAHIFPSVRNDMAGFMNKLLARKSELSQARKPPVKAPPPLPPLEPDDDFLILEDDAPLKFSFPKKNVSTARKKLSKSPSSNKESSTDKETKDCPVEVPEKQKEAEIAISKPDSQAVDQRKKKKKGKEKNPEVVISADHKGDLLSHQELPAGDPMEQEKPKSKKQMKRVSSAQSDKTEDRPKDKTIVQPDKEAPAEKKTGTKEHKSTKKKNLKDKKENTPKGGTNSLKEKKKQPAAVKEPQQDDFSREKGQEHSVQEAAATDDLRGFTDKGTKSKEDEEAKQDEKSTGYKSSSSEDFPILRKRKKKMPGEWWISTPQSSDKAADNLNFKMSKQRTEESSIAGPSTLKNKDNIYSRRKPIEPKNVFSDHTNKAKKNKGRQTKGRKEKRKQTEKNSPAEDKLEEPLIPDQDLDQDPRPFSYSKRDQSLNSGGEPFPKVYHHNPNIQKSATSTASQSQSEKQLGDTESRKRRRKPPVDWWAVHSEANDLEVLAPQSPLKEPKQQKGKEKRPIRAPTRPAVPRQDNSASKTKRRAPEKPRSAPKTVKRSLADIFTSATETLAVATNRDAHQFKMRNVTSQSTEENTDTSPAMCSGLHAGVPSGADADECSQLIPQERLCQTELTSRVLRSGPSSMIQLEKYDDDDMNLPSSIVRSALSMADFCAPPLKPLTLHSTDQKKLLELFQRIWSTEADAGSATISPDMFQWYFYRDQALGIQVDINSSAVCSGKLIMGSYMKKPLWVDHSATTIFNLLTSSVSVTVDSCVSHYKAGQAFMVESGRAYSIQNDNLQPAVLYFTRMLAETLD